MKPPKSCLDPTFAYTGSAQTDLEKTFRRIRKLLSEEARARAENENEAQAKTVQLPKRNKA